MNGQQINYQIIIDYLSQKQNKQMIEGFPTKENIIVNSKDFPKKIRKFFNKNYFRYGSMTYDTDHNNISFYSSLLLCLDDQYLTYNEETRLLYISIFKRKLKNEYLNQKLYKKFGYKKFNITSEVIADEISNQLSYPVLQLIVDYLDINIILFNFDDMKRYSFHSSDIMNTYKSTLLFGLGNGYYEPIITNKKKIFCFNDKVIKKILINNIYRMNLEGKPLLEYNNDIYHMINDIVNIESVVNSEEEKSNLSSSSNQPILLKMSSDNVIIDDEDLDDEALNDEALNDEVNDETNKADDSELNLINSKVSEETNKADDPDLNLINSKFVDYSLSKFMRMRKDELLDILNNLQLNIGEYQTKTKKQIAEGIVNKISALN